MPRTPNRGINVRGVVIDTPDETREERRRRRNSRRDADDDDADEIEDEESEDLRLQGLDALSTAELRNLSSAIGTLNKLTPDALSALTSRPLQTVQQVAVAGWSLAFSA